jgi:hypothetical protein
MSFEETPDYRELLDTSTLYLLRLQRVQDRTTRLGTALEWRFEVHNRDSTPVLDDNNDVVVITRLSSPRLGPRTRARAFVNRLLGRDVPSDELKVLVQSGRLADQLKNKQALGYIVFTDADGNESEFPKVNELFSLDVAKSGRKLPPPPRSYAAVFDDDDAAEGSPATSAAGDVPF